MTRDDFKKDDISFIIKFDRISSHSSPVVRELFVKSIISYLNSSYLPIAIKVITDARERKMLLLHYKKYKIVV